MLLPGAGVCRSVCFRDSFVGSLKVSTDIILISQPQKMADFKFKLFFWFGRPLEKWRITASSLSDGLVWVWVDLQDEVCDFGSYRLILARIWLHTNTPQWHKVVCRKTNSIWIRCISIMSTSSFISAECFRTRWPLTRALCFKSV